MDLSLMVALLCNKQILRIFYGKIHQINHIIKKETFQVFLEKSLFPYIL